MNNYERITKIYKYLREETDEDHQLTTNELLNKLKNELNVYMDRKTLRKNLRFLEDYGVDIIINKNSQNSIFIGERELSLEEVKLLIDAVTSCKLITKDKTDKLVNKLLKFISKHQAKQLLKNNYIENEVKPTNADVYKIMNIINSAINIDKQIMFQYYEYTPNKVRIKKYNGRFYKLSPYKLMWNNDHYYLIGYNEKYKSLSKYRVDRIAKEITIIDNDIIHDKDDDLGKFIKRTFNMYDGEPQNIELLCENEMMNYIIDKFGEDIKTRIINSEKFIATVTVSISPTFFSWVFGFNGKIVILSPNSAKYNYINLIKNQYNIYENKYDGE